LRSNGLSDLFLRWIKWAGFLAEKGELGTLAIRPAVNNRIGIEPNPLAIDKS